MRPMGEPNGDGMLARICFSSRGPGKPLLVYRDNPRTTEIQIWAQVGYLCPQLPLILFSRWELAVKLRSKVGFGSVTLFSLILLSYSLYIISSRGIDSANTVAVLWVIFSKQQHSRGENQICYKSYYQSYFTSLKCGNPYSSGITMERFKEQNVFNILHGVTSITL